MTSRELIRSLIAGEDVPRCGFWVGNPHPDTWPIYHSYFHTQSDEELRRLLNDDFRWITPQYMDTTYRHPQGKGLLDVWKYKKSLGEAGPLSASEDPEQVDAFEWPEPDYLDFDECLGVLRHTGPYYRASGFWAPFFHDAMDLFGVEQFMVKLHTHAHVIDRTLEHICGFYLEANERFYEQAGDLIDGYFFGNDFGTQRDLFISPGLFERFFLPWVKTLADQAREHGYQVLFHSCGSVARIIPLLIGAGIQCLHPLQARAGKMEAEQLAKEFKGRIAFLGGIDTQDLLVNGSEEAIKAEVRRVKGLLGPNLIVSPSHEALLPNVPPASVKAMAEAAREDMKGGG